MADAPLDAGPEHCGHRLLSRVAEVIALLLPSQTLAVVAYDPSSELDLKICADQSGTQQPQGCGLAHYLTSPRPSGR